MTHGLGPGKPGPRAAKPITPPYVKNNYRIEVKITFMLIAYLVLLCEFFWEFSIFRFCRPLVDIYWHPLLSSCLTQSLWNSCIKISETLSFGYLYDLLKYTKRHAFEKGNIQTRDKELWQSLRVWTRGINKQQLKTSGADVLSSREKTQNLT